MKFAGVILMGILLIPLFVPSASAVSLTSSWQIETYNESVKTTEFEAKSFLNISVYPPQTLATGGVRLLTVYSQAEQIEIARYSLGYYPSGGNQTETPRNISVNLGAFPQLIHGDTLLLQILDPVDAVEFTAAISVSEDIDALLEAERKLFLGLFGDLEKEIALLRWQIGETGRTLTNYILVLGIVMGVMVAYITRDTWLNRKRKDDEQKSTTEFEAFLETFVLERYQSGDQKEEEVKSEG